MEKGICRPWLDQDSKSTMYLMGFKSKAYCWDSKAKKYKAYYYTNGNSSFPEVITEARKHLGKEYVTWLEFVIAKALAPKRFTCTSLIWYAAKKTMEIDISPWYSTVVSPTDVYISDYTYIKEKINVNPEWFTTRQSIENNYLNND